jgi:hypothetical protein
MPNNPQFSPFLNIVLNDRDQCIFQQILIADEGKLTGILLNSAVLDHKDPLFLYFEIDEESQQLTGGVTIEARANNNLNDVLYRQVCPENKTLIVIMAVD